jgi:hypothetical protein
LLTKIDINQIRHYQTRVDFAPYAKMMGGEFMFVLGVLLEAVGGGDDDFFSESKLRNDLLSKPSKERHLLSVCKYSSATGLLSFFLREQDFESMAKKGWSLYVIRTDSWTKISHSMKLSRVKLANEQFFS